MKKILLVITLFTKLITNAQTSIYHPFPDSSARWNFHCSLAMCSLGGTVNSYYSIIMTGDTLIDSQIYHKLETPFVQSAVTGNCTPWITNGYKGAIREDTALKKVFYVQPSDSIEQLLYDFNLQVGDTVKGFLESFAFPADTVQSIDSVLIGSGYRKRWNINTCYNISIIEGIGSLYGFKEPSPGCITDAPDFSLLCFMQDGQTLYPDTTTNCELINGMETSYLENIFISVSPNPFSKELIVNQNNNTDVSEITLYDIESRKIMMQQFSNTVTLNTEHLTKGIYIFEVRNKNGLSRKGKIVKE